MACIQSGVMKSGHQHPPSGASVSEASTAADDALFTVRTSEASMTPNAEDATAMSTETAITATGETPKSMEKAKMPSAQRNASWMRPR